MIKEAINKLILKEELNEFELKESFDEVFSGLADNVQSASFLSLINQFDDNVIISALSSSSAAFKKPFSVFLTDELIQNISLSFKTSYIDIALLQDLICASCGLSVAKHFFDSPLNKENSLKVLAEMGVNIEQKIDYSTLDWEKLNFYYFFLSSENPYFKYSEPLRNALPFDNVFNLTHKLINPIGAKNLFLGVKERNDVEKFANIALKLNKINSIVVSGCDNFPFISPNGESCIAEAWKNKVFSYSLTPELLGFNEADFSEIECENSEQNANDILEIIYNKKKGPKFEIAVLNAGLSLYIAKKADSIVDGINLAKKLIEDNQVAQKFEQIKAFYLQS